MARIPLTPKSIFAAAADLADRDGFDAIVVSAVARTLGVQTASLYGHVRDRAAILAGVQELAMGELADVISDEIAGRSGLDALAALGAAQRTYARTSPGRWESLQRRVEPGVERSESTIRVATLTRAVLRGYRLSDDDVVHAARMGGAMVAGFIALERTGAFDHRDQSTEESWRRSVEALDIVFTSWAARSAGSER
ncbi:hypothetical protein AX769_08255 [Frondihabitans sp. PAMC 28766]|uniref:TetR/AcrR family transcriptional regulator n=1 Tax=Frondihabitans sp. PAMC 28766 TaxID=1795630 RepID=UPI00078CBBBA|nr:TetR-like C-terminal domain-containing protein [Frondihabitans sp. PAMC 28766]AMM20159.1 hypothetical protein AX769_08255 [Frondihabitans sp. PAMC 28766]